MSSSVLQAHLNPAGNLLALLPRVRFCCCYDFCFEVRSTSAVVGLDLKISPDINISFKSGEYDEGHHVCG